MKRNVMFILASAFCVLTLDSCQIAQLIISSTTHYDAEIATKDERLVAGRIGGLRSSNLPSGAKTISIKTTEGRQKIKSEQINYMKLARKNHPEEQQTLIYTDVKEPYTRRGQQMFRDWKSWQVINSVGDNLIITAFGGSFSLSKNGALVITYSMDEGIKYCIRRPGDASLIFFGRSTYSRSAMRKQWQEYLADDPVLCEKIKNKEIDAFDFKTIAEQYNPNRK